MSDVEDLRAYQRQRDADSFRRLVLRYQGLVYSTCCRTLNNLAEAEDAAQETFLKLARSAGTIRSDLGAWLHSCALNTAKDRRDSRRARRRREEAWLHMQQPEYAEDWRDLVPVVDDCIAELPEDDRELLVQHYFAGRTQTDLAAERGVSQQATAKQLGRIVATLRQGLRGKGVTVSAAILGAFLAESPGEAAVPAALTESLCKIGLVGVSEAGGTATGIHGSPGPTLRKTVAGGTLGTLGRKVATVLGVVVVLSGLMALRRREAPQVAGGAARLAVPARVQGTGGRGAGDDSGPVLPRLRKRRAADPDVAGVAERALSGDKALLLRVAEAHRANREAIDTWRGSARVEESGPREGGKSKEALLRWDVDFAFHDEWQWTRFVYRLVGSAVVTDGAPGASPPFTVHGLLKTPSVTCLTGDLVTFMDNPPRAMVYASDHINAGIRIHAYHFDPAWFLDYPEHPQGIAAWLLFLVENADNPRMVGRRTVRREGDIVILESRARRRYEFDLTQGSQVVGWSSPEKTTSVTWECREGLWTPKVFTQTSTHARGHTKRITFLDSELNAELIPDDFTLQSIGVEEGDVVHDTRRRNRRRFRYGDRDIPLTFPHG